MNTFEEPDYDIAVVGAGFCGAMVSLHLARQRPHWRVLLADKGAEFGPGIVYNPSSEDLLLNVPAGNMSAFPEQPDDFCDWLNAHSSELRRKGITDFSREAFLPRKVYGQYISSLLQNTARLSPGLTTAKLEVVDIDVKGAFAVLTDHLGKSITASKVVLALGNFPPGDPMTHDRAFHQSARYLDSSCPPAILDKMRSADSILILGAGLSTLDLIVALKDTAKPHTIHVVSKHGLFPQSHRPHPARSNLFDQTQFPRTIHSLLHLVRRQVSASKSNGEDWRAVIDALRPHTQAIWKSLSIEERRRFLRHVRPYWETHRHRAAPAMLEMKDRMIESGRLICHRARVVSIREDGDSLDVTLVDKEEGVETTLQVAYVVNCRMALR